MMGLASSTCVLLIVLPLFSISFLLQAPRISFQSGWNTYRTAKGGNWLNANSAVISRAMTWCSAWLMFHHVLCGSEVSALVCLRHSCHHSRRRSCQQLGPWRHRSHHRHCHRCSRSCPCCNRPCCWPCRTCCFPSRPCSPCCSHPCFRSNHPCCCTHIPCCSSSHPYCHSLGTSLRLWQQSDYIVPFPSQEWRVSANCTWPYISVQTKKHWPYPWPYICCIWPQHCPWPHWQIFTTSNKWFGLI